jgi:stage II sporulation protein M
MKKRKRGKGKFSLKEEYKESWGYIKKAKNFIYVAIGIFLFSSLIGFFITPPEIISEKIFEFIKNLLAQTEGMSAGRLISFIFFNNLQSTFFALIFGIFFGIFPAITAFANGYLVGFVASIASQEGNILELWRLFPHGIFELPAVFISIGMGLKLGTFIFQKDKIKSFKDYFLNSVRVFLLVVLPLLIIAAIIEGSLIALG